MQNNNSLNLEELALQCKLNTAVEASETIGLIKELAKQYDESDLVLIYNYFFDRSTVYEVIMLLIRLIDKLRDKSSVSVLVDTLIMREKFKDRIKDEDSRTQIRVMVAKALANLKDTQAVYPLLYCLNNKDENYKIRLSCAEALGKIGDKYAVSPLVDLLEDENESSVYIKESAATALGMLGDMKAVDPLVSILETKKGIIDKFTFLKERAIEALNKINFKSDRVFKALKNSLIDESVQVRINAIEALMNTDDDRVIPLIKSMLNDIDQEVVKNAVIALYNLEGEEILAEILHKEDSSDFAKLEASSLLDEIAHDDEDDENE
ncbi:MAG: HEAT repeat domain-containing protein [Candidatus Gastranaerophilales bacterium]|nr:HEAT repeat domain-containing protein [Candidatus Gastranaerophilales bacterium]